MKETMLYKMTHAEYHPLLGKRIEVMHNGRRIVGIAEFIGINTILHNQFQVTISRLPLWPIDPNTIKLVPTPIRICK